VGTAVGAAVGVAAGAQAASVPASRATINKTLSFFMDSSFFIWIYDVDEIF
jgi:hypothetical protein